MQMSSSAFQHPSSKTIQQNQQQNNTRKNSFISADHEDTNSYVLHSTISAPASSLSSRSSSSLLTSSLLVSQNTTTPTSSSSYPYPTTSHSSFTYTQPTSSLSSSASVSLTTPSVPLQSVSNSTNINNKNIVHQISKPPSPIPTSSTTSQQQQGKTAKSSSPPIIQKLQPVSRIQQNDTSSQMRKRLAFGNIIPTKILINKNPTMISSNSQTRPSPSPTKTAHPRDGNDNRFLTSLIQNFDENVEISDADDLSNNRISESMPPPTFPDANDYNNNLQSDAKFNSLPSVPSFRSDSPGSINSNMSGTHSIASASNLNYSDDKYRQRSFSWDTSGTKDSKIIGNILSSALTSDANTFEKNRHDSRNALSSSSMDRKLSDTNNDQDQISLELLLQSLPSNPTFAQFKIVEQWVIEKKKLFKQQEISDKIASSSSSASNSNSKKQYLISRKDSGSSSGKYGEETELMQLNHDIKPSKRRTPSHDYGARAPIPFVYDNHASNPNIFNAHGIDHAL